MASRLTKAQRKAKNKKKYEKRKCNRAKIQQKTNPPAPPMPAPIQTEQQRQPAPIEDTTQQQASTEATKSQPSTRAECAIAWFTGILTVFAIVQGVAMIAQNNIMKDQMAQTDKTLDVMRLEQRPWISASTPEMEALEFDSPFRGVVPVLNTGTTPAWLTSGAVTHYFRLGDEDISKRIEKFWVDAEQQRRNDVLAPNARMQMHATMAPIRTIPEQHETILKLIEGRKVSVFVVGQICYRDIYDRPHYTRFCFVFNPETKTYWAYREYNDMN